jgi:ribokinase
MAKIAVVGSANVDLVARVPRLPLPGETIIGSDFIQAMGGKGANQAVAAARLGAEVAFIARVGDDAYGDACLQSYREAGVNIEAVGRTPHTSTGIALIPVDDQGENQIIVISGANAKLSAADVESSASLIRSADVLLLQMEVPDETNRAAIHIAYEMGKTIILNPAPYRPIERSLLNKISVLTPNLTEAEHLIGDVLADDEVLAKSLLGMGVQSAVITLGTKGALVAGSWGWLRIPVYEVTAVDTTGAGDAFNAGLAVGLAEGKSLEQAARFASAVAALAVTQMGAQPGMPTRSQVEAFLSTP